MNRPDPPRMLDAQYGASEFARSALQEGMHCDPTPDQCERLRRRMLPLLGAGAVVGTSMTASGVSWATKLVGWFGGGVLAGGVALVAWTTRFPGDHHDQAPAVEAGVAGSVVQSVGSVPHASPPLAVSSAVSPEQVLAPRNAAPGGAPSVAVEPSLTLPATSAERPIPPAQPNEVDLLNRAVRSLEQGRAAEALSLTDEHVRLPAARMGQERERIAIEALVRLGQMDAARTRASQFSRQYPGSSYWPRIEKLVEDVPRSVGSAQSP